jgi:2-polyprenyl-3-methyl-5-hydroxy-6-metoxy-1,4-benzoquinol methylase
MIAIFAPEVPVKKALKKLLQDPFGTLHRAFAKKVLGPLRYGKEAGYAAEDYWRDRFNKHGTAYKGPGEEGLSEEENQAMYQVAIDQVCEEIRLLSEADQRSLDQLKLMEVGLGNGSYTRALYQMGIRQYQGYDITDALFEEHRQHCPGFEMHKADISEEALPEGQQVVLFIDVLQHIVEAEKFQAALKNLWQATAPGGYLFITPLVEKSERIMFYLAAWSREDILGQLPGHEIIKDFEFRENRMLLLRKPAP